MDTYVVEVYDVRTGFLQPTEDTNADCQRCLENPYNPITNPNGCSSVEHPRVCACGGATPATFEDLAPQMLDVRVPSLDLNDIYCMRVVAVNRGAAPAPTTPAPPAQSCTCTPLWYDISFLKDNAKLCAVGTPRPVGPQLIDLTVMCPNDNGQFSGRGGNNNLTFNACINPTMM